MFSQGPPTEKKPFLTCSDSYVPPILDVVGGGLMALAMAGARQQHMEMRTTDAEYHGALTTSAVMMALDAASAAYGVVSAMRCSEAQQERVRELAKASVLPPPYGAMGSPPPAWPPPNLRPAGPPPVAPGAPAPAPPPPPAEPQVVPFTP
jgi:hypothetical protein